MIIVSGKLYVDPPAREAYLHDSFDVVVQARRAPGCLDFALTPDPIEPGRINVYERWDSDADLARFRGTGPSPEQSTRIRDAEVAKYRISAVEDP